jgi:hypothetical protein
LGDNATGSLLNDSAFLPCQGTNSLGATTVINNCGSVAAAALGVVSIASQLFTRSGSNLALNPPLSNAFDQSIIPYYNIYASDTWHMKPTFTLTYGLGWALEMPPYEKNGKQTMVVDDAGNPVGVSAYIDERRAAALQGNIFNPELGFALVGNTAGGRKYPYNPYYGEFSPRVALAWNPHFDSDSLGGKIFGHENTVLRGGYGRSYGRTNGVAQVLLPLLGLGLEQPVSCNSNVVTGGTWGCAPNGAGNWSDGFRVSTTAGANGGPTVPLSGLATPTLPQPVYPGFNNTYSSTDSSLDVNIRPSSIDSFNLTLQRQLGRRVILEVGYIGRRIENEFEPVNLNAVPYMYTQGGQTFANAYMNTVLQYCGGTAGLAGGGCGGSALVNAGVGPQAGAVQPQPFFESALSPSYCAGFSSCTAAVVANEGASGSGALTNAQVWGLWSDIDSAGGFGQRTMLSSPIAANCAALGGTGTNGCTGQFSGVYVDTANGHSNYNAGFASLKMAEWRGLTMQSNFTWAKALGTGAQAQASSELTALDPFNMSEMYGRQAFDRKFIYNTFIVYQPPFYKGQQGVIGRLLGGWTFSTIFTAGSGVPDQAVTTLADYQSFGACDGITCADYDSENAVPANSSAAEHTKAYYCGTVTAGFAACPGQGPGSSYPLNAFKDGALEYQNWRNPILGLDNRDGGYGIISGLNYWNMDFSIKKNIRVAESVGLEFQGVFANVLNHDQWFDGFPCLCEASTFGALGGQATPRNIELGARVRF